MLVTEAEGAAPGVEGGVKCGVRMRFPPGEVTVFDAPGCWLCRIMKLDRGARKRDSTTMIATPARMIRKSHIFTRLCDGMTPLTLLFVCHSTSSLRSPCSCSTFLH